MTGRLQPVGQRAFHHGREPRGLHAAEDVQDGVGRRWKEQAAVRSDAHPGGVQKGWLKCR